MLGKSIPKPIQECSQEMGWTRGQKIDMQNGERVNLSDRLLFVLLTAPRRMVTIRPV
jgi:hypothetical protein